MEHVANIKLHAKIITIEYLMCLEKRLKNTDIVEEVSVELLILV